MKALEKKFNSLVWKARFGAESLKDKAKNALKKEDGDTNFLSIIIILAIVLVVAIVFISLKDKIVKLIQTEWTDFSTKFSTSDTDPFGTPS